jgi:alanyl-tRNA synthetase
MELTHPPFVSGAYTHKRFLGYLRTLGHTIVPSSSLVLDDPTLFFTNAGMVHRCRLLSN